MAVDSAWLQENLGGAPRSAGGGSALGEQAERAGVELTPQELARQRIDFDGEAPAALARSAAWPDAPPTLTKFLPIPWPAGMAPQSATDVPGGESLPHADVLIVTWTLEEGRALAHVLTPGYESHPPGKSDAPAPGMGYWKPYTKNYAAISAHMNPFAPARETKRLGTYWAADIAGKKVVLFKSESHMSQDGPEVLATTPNRLVWRQIIEDCRPDWVITTGTAGGIGAREEVGDVIVSRHVTFDSGGHPPKFEPFTGPDDVPADHLDAARDLFGANAANLPKTNAARRASCTARARIAASSRPTASSTTTRPTPSNCRARATSARWATPCSPTSAPNWGPTPLPTRWSATSPTPRSTPLTPKRRLGQLDL